MGFLAVIGLLALAPLLALGGALLRALVLFWPVMILFGMLHAQVPAVPAFSWWVSFLIIALLSLLVPTATSSSSD